MTKFIEKYIIFFGAPIAFECYHFYSRCDYGKKKIESICVGAELTITSNSKYGKLWLMLKKRIFLNTTIPRISPSKLLFLLFITQLHK